VVSRDERKILGAKKELDTQRKNGCWGISSSQPERHMAQAEGRQKRGVKEERHPFCKVSNGNGSDHRLQKRRRGAAQKSVDFR